MVIVFEVIYVLYLYDVIKKKIVFLFNFSIGINKLVIGVIIKSDVKDVDVNLVIKKVR